MKIIDWVLGKKAQQQKSSLCDVVQSSEAKVKSAIAETKTACRALEILITWNVERSFNIKEEQKWQRNGVRSWQRNMHSRQAEKECPAALQTLHSSIPKLEQHIISLKEDEQKLEMYLELSLDEETRIKVKNSLAKVKSAISEVLAAFRAVEIVMGDPFAELYMKRWMELKRETC